MRRNIVLCGVAMLAACNEQDVYLGDLQEVVVLPAIPNRNIDLLFVIDSSPSMGDEQAAMIASFPKMMDALATLDGGLPNLHVGVITTDLGVSTTSGVASTGIGTGLGSCASIGDDGTLQHDAPELAGALYISDLANPDGTRMRNYSGELRDVFAKIATVGVNGCGFEQPLAAIRRALENPANAGFFRPDASLAIVLLTDEDDCSAKHPDLFLGDTTMLGVLRSFRCTRFGVTCDGGGATPDAMNMVGVKTDCRANGGSAYVDDVSTYVDYLVGLKNDPYAVMVAAIVGDPKQVEVELGWGDEMIPTLARACTTAISTADPAVRIGELVAAFPQRGIVTSICDTDLSLSLTSIGYTAKKLVGDPCLDAPLVDTSVAQGVQPICEVIDGPALGGERTLRACNGTSDTDCWRLVQDSSCTRSPEALRFEVVRSVAPAEQSYARLRCRTRR